MKKIRFLFPVILVVLFLARGTLAGGPNLEGPLKKVKLPNKDWTFKDPEKENQRILHPIKIGQAVNIRVHTYEVPVSAKEFLTQVRSKILEKPDYQGAEVQMIQSEQVKGKTWDNFNIKRKDEINQQIWGIKASSDVVVMVIYTGAGDYFKEYYDGLKKVLEKLS
jgi:hypothetical protein